MDCERLGGPPCCRRLCRRKVTVSRSSLTPFVRISPMGHGGTPRNVCAFSETSIRYATAASETFSLSPCSLSPFPYKEFSRPLSHSLSGSGGTRHRLRPADFLRRHPVADYAVVPFSTIFLLSHGGFISSLIMWLHVFTVPESMLLIIVQSTNDFYLLAL